MAKLMQSEPTTRLVNPFTADADVNDIAESVRQHGYAIVHGAMRDGMRDRLVSELSSHLDSTAFGEEDFWGHKTKRFGALVAKSATACEMTIDPMVLGVVDEVLLKYCANYWLNYTGVMYLAPGESAQPLHRDTNLWPFANPAPPLTLATMWAVSDFTENNGATRIVPGSHLWDDDRQPQPHEVIAAQMPAGSVLLYTGNLIHGGGANQSSDVRYGVALHYVLGWLRQEETQLLTLSKEQALALPEKLQRLVGYSLGASALGMVDHLDPYEYLTGKREDRPHALSSPQLDANETAMRRLKVVESKPQVRSRYNVT